MTRSDGAGIDDAAGTRRPRINVRGIGTRYLPAPNPHRAGASQVSRTPFDGVVPSAGALVRVLCPVVESDA